MGIASAMMKTTMKSAFLMEEIVADLMSKNNSAQNANALEELQHLPELPLPEAAISILVMGIVMISTTI